MGIWEPTADFGAGEKGFDCRTKQVYQAFIKSVVLFPWPTHLWNVNSVCLWIVWHVERCFSTFLMHQLLAHIFYGLVVCHDSIPAVSCHNILSLTVPIPFTLSTPCLPCPMLFDMHISWSHKRALLIQNTAVRSSPACIVLFRHITGTAGGLRLRLCTFTLTSDPLWDQTPAL